MKTMSAQYPNLRQQVYIDVIAERQRQEQKWGQQNHTPEWWMLILGEEYGEAAQAALESKFSDWSPERYREEMVQVAAVAIAAIECYDRHKEQNNAKTGNGTT